MTLLIKEFTDYLSLELNYSPRTVEAYTRDLEKWAMWEKSQNSGEFQPLALTERELRSYIASCSGNGLSPRSVKRHIQALRAFYKFLIKQKGASSNPAASLKSAKAEKLLPVYIRTEELQEILTQEPEIDSFEEKRNLLILDLLYSTGIRVSELAALNDQDIYPSSSEIKVMGKRRKQRIIPISAQMLNRIKGYIAERDKRFHQTNPAQRPLFLNSKGASLSRTQIYNIVHRALLSGGAHGRRLSPHVLRHCCATDLLRHGASLVAVKNLLGHSALSSTQIYTHLSFNEIKDTYSNAHPRALENNHNV